MKNKDLTKAQLIELVETYEDALDAIASDLSLDKLKDKLIKVKASELIDIILWDTRTAADALTDVALIKEKRKKV